MSILLVLTLAILLMLSISPPFYSPGGSKVSFSSSFFCCLISCSVLPVNPSLACGDSNTGDTTNGGCDDKCNYPLRSRPSYLLPFALLGLIRPGYSVCNACGPGFAGHPDLGCFDINECETNNGGW
jgi:hypothetical protein